MHFWSTLWCLRIARCRWCRLVAAMNSKRSSTTCASIGASARLRSATWATTHQRKRIRDLCELFKSSISAWAVYTHRKVGMDGSPVCWSWSTVVDAIKLTWYLLLPAKANSPSTDYEDDLELNWGASIDCLFACRQTILLLVPSFTIYSMIDFPFVKCLVGFPRVPKPTLVQGSCWHSSTTPHSKRGSSSSSTRIFWYSNIQFLEFVSPKQFELCSTRLLWLPAVLSPRDRHE